MTAVTVEKVEPTLYRFTCGGRTTHLSTKYYRPAETPEALSRTRISVFYGIGAVAPGESPEKWAAVDEFIRLADADAV